MSSSGKALMAEIATQPDPAAEPGRPTRTRSACPAGAGRAAAAHPPGHRRGDVAAASRGSRSVDQRHRRRRRRLPPDDLHLLSHPRPAAPRRHPRGDERQHRGRHRLLRRAGRACPHRRAGRGAQRRDGRQPPARPQADQADRGRAAVGRGTQARLSPHRLDRGGTRTGPPAAGSGPVRAARLRARGGDRLGGVRRALRRARPQRGSGPRDHHRRRDHPRRRRPGSGRRWHRAAGTGAGTDSDSPN